MQNHEVKSTVLNSALIVLVALATLAVTLVGVGWSWVNGQIYIEHIGIIDIACFILFVCCCLLGIKNDKWYYRLLPFMLLAFPTAVNNFFPAVNLGTEYPITTFPLLTHIDLYLFLGVCRNYYVRRKLQIHTSGLMAVVVCAFFMSSFINLFTIDSQRIALIIAGLFPLRYTILMILLISNVDLLRYEREIVTGLVICVFFLLVEATVNTALFPNDVGVLASGSLAANTFANIISSILVFFVLIWRKRLGIGNLLFYTVVLVGLYIIIMTETRMALLAGFLSFLFIQFIQHNIFKSILISATILTFAIIVYVNVKVPQRYSASAITSHIKFLGFHRDPMQMFKIEKTRETSSLYSRLQLFSTSVKMFFDNPFFGTGYGTYNYLKLNYGFTERVIIDSHNGYLNTIAQLGLMGLPLLLFIYFVPFTLYRKLKNRLSSPLVYLFAINTTMAVADLSNAGIYKYSVFALLVFISVFLTILYRRQAT